MNFLLETLLGVLVTSTPVQEKIEPARTAIIQSIPVQSSNQSSNKESEKANEPSNTASSPSKK
jgi:hypothetical protein